MTLPVTTAPAQINSGPWWRHGFMWLVVGGPLTVVVAAVVTAVIAVRGADIVLDTQSVGRDAGAGMTNAPAVSARNHVVTPARP